MVLIKEKAETRGAKLVKSSCFKDRTKRQMHKIYLYEIMQNYIRKLVDTHNDKKKTTSRGAYWYVKKVDFQLNA